MWTNLIYGAGFAFTAVGQPGPLQAFYLSQALAIGWRRTVVAALAPLFSDGPIIALVLLVLTNLPEVVLSGIQVGGGLFILYLAIGAWRALRPHHRIESEGAAANFAPLTSSWQILGKAIGMNLLNPAPYLFWGTILGPRLLDTWAHAPLHAGALLLGFYATFIGGLSLLIVLFGKAGQIHPQINRLLAIASTLILFAFGFYQLTTGLMKLLPVFRSQ